MKNIETAASLQLLTFRLGSETFAVEVARTREVLDLAEVTRVPHTPEYMLGVINLRGSVVPVIDLRVRFGLPDAGNTRDTCVVVLEVEAAGERLVVGAVADSVLEVLELEASLIEPPPRIGVRLDTQFIRGMGNRGGEFLIILDIDRIFSSEEVSVLQEGTEESFPVSAQA